MFTVEQIELAHSKIRSGSEFPKYIQDIKVIGVTAFETWVTDSHSEYFGKDNFRTKSKPKYKEITITNNCSRDKFVEHLRIHQKGETDYFTFCKHCAETGIEKWIVRLDEMTCIYYDKNGNEILVEIVPIV
jgi:uncharacterized protein YbcV (DUF1398 family)